MLGQQSQQLVYQIMEAQIISSSQQFSLQLLDPYTCIITNLPFKLTDQDITTYELVPSLTHNGYVVKLKMLISLKRIFQKSVYPLPGLSNTAFKIFKPFSLSSMSFDLKRNQTMCSGSKKLMKAPKNNQSCHNVQLYCQKYSVNAKERKISIMHIGRVILTSCQKEAIDFFLRKGKRIILSESWNMEKTVTSLACMKYGKCRRILIICPKILFPNWLWNIKQMQNSLSKPFSKVSKSTRAFNVKKQVKLENFKQKNQNHDFQVLILDYIKKQAKDNISNGSLKQQTAKSQVKFKHQQLNNYKGLHFTICSSENFMRKDVELNMKSFDGLIINETPEMKQSLQSNCQKLQKLSQIDSIIICSNKSVENLIYYIPIINPKMEWEQLKERYIRNGILINQHQYRNSMYKNYYFGKRFDSPFSKGLIKYIYVFDKKSDRQKMELQKNVFESTNSQLTDNNLIIDFSLKKINSTVEYLKYRTKECQKKQQIYLLYTHLPVKQNLIIQFQNNNIEIRPLKIARQIQGLQNCNKNEIRIGNIDQIISHFCSECQQKQEFRDRSKSTVIICDVFKKYDSRQNSIQSKLCQVFRYSQIQYLQLCDFNQQTYQIKLLQQKDSRLYYPSIATSSFVSQLITDGQYIPSQGSSQIVINTKKNINPQRYQQSDSDSVGLENKMIDEKQEQIQYLNKNNLLNGATNPKDIIQIQQDSIFQGKNEKSSENIGQINLNFPVNGQENQKLMINIQNIEQICLEGEQQFQKDIGSSVANKNKQEIVQQYKINIHCKSNIKNAENIDKKIDMIELNPLNKENKRRKTKIKKGYKFQQQKHDMQEENNNAGIDPLLSTIKKRSNRIKNKQLMIDEKNAQQQEKRRQKQKQIFSEDKMDFKRITRSKALSQKNQKKNKHQIMVKQKGKKNAEQSSQNMLYTHQQKTQQLQRKAGKKPIQVVEIMSDEDNSHTLMQTPKPQKSRPKQVLMVKLVPRLSHLLNASLAMQ